MKFLKSLLTISLFLLILPASPTQIQQYDTLSFETPKASSLNNVYGKPFLAQEVAPITQMAVIGPNGMAETLYQNTSLLNQPQENLCLFRDEPIIKLCESLSCDLCMSSRKCGWCGASNKCVPGNSNAVSCEKDCLSSWIFSDNSKCQNNVKSGNLNNIAPESNKLINPTLAEPKLAINVMTPDVIDHTVKVKYGEQHLNQVTTLTTNDGAIHTIQENSVKPLVGELHKEIVVNNKLETKYVSLNNGTELKKDESLKTFGLDSLQKHDTNITTQNENRTNIETATNAKNNKSETSFLK